MRSLPAPFPYRLSFLMPDGALLDRALAHYGPIVEGCDLTVHAAGLVIFSGPSREAVFANVGQFVEMLWPFARGQAIAATMVTEAHAGVPSGRDSWTIIVGRQVAFCPTSMPPHFPPLAARPPPALAVLPGGRAP